MGARYGGRPLRGERKALLGNAQLRLKRGEMRKRIEKQISLVKVL